MPERGLEDYASPILRASVFRRLYPGAQISYSVVAIDEAFPMGHREYEGKAVEAVRCEIIFADGTYIVAHKEIDSVEYAKGGWKERPQTPENLAKDETKAMGRAFRDAGIPQRLSELKVVMMWYPNAPSNVVNTSSLVRPPVADSGGVQEQLAEAFPGSTEIDDGADAGADEPTVEQLLAKRFAMLDGPRKAEVVAYARGTLGCSNVLRAGEHAEALMAHLDQQPTNGYVVTADEQAVLDDIEARGKARQVAAQEQPPEEPFLSLGIQHVEGYRNQVAP